MGETHRYTKRQVNKAGVKLRKELKEVKRRVNKYTEYMSKYEGHPRHLDYETITGEKYTGQEDSAQWYEAMKTRLLAVRQEVGRLHTQHRNEQIQKHVSKLNAAYHKNKKKINSKIFKPRSDVELNVLQNQDTRQWYLTPSTVLRHCAQYLARLMRGN